jgi:hypothetical protein
MTAWPAVTGLVDGLTVVVVGVSAGADPVSTAPASQVEPLPGRGYPRWSVGTLLQPDEITPIAALPASGSIVNVGPPLSCRGPSIGSALVPGQVVPPQVTLPPRSAKFVGEAPLSMQFESETSPLLAMIVFFSWTLDPYVS